MRKWSICAVALLVVLIPIMPAYAVTPEQSELVNWMMFYYQQPEPERFPEKFKAFSDNNLFDDEKKQFSLLGFASTIFKDNPNIVSQTLKAIDKLPQDHKKVILLSMWLSGSKESREVFQKSEYKKTISGSNYYNFDTDNSPPDLNTINNTYGGFLDIQWGRFLATGKKEYVRLIISTLSFGDFWGAHEKYAQPLSEEGKISIKKEAIFKAALWSLQSNCKMHQVVRKYCDEIYQEGGLSESEKKYLRLLLLKVYPEKYKS